MGVPLLLAPAGAEIGGVERLRVVSRVVIVAVPRRHGARGPLECRDSNTSQTHDTRVVEVSESIFQDISVASGTTINLTQYRCLETLRLGPPKMDGP